MTPAAEVATLFDVLAVPELTARFNIAPTQPVLTIGRAATGRAAGFMRWGLVPGWAGGADEGLKHINARAETVAERPAFREALRRRRCLIPADGFYEWKGEGKRRVPHLFRRPDRQPFVFAGLWDRWVGDDGPPLLTCALITTDANGVFGAVHDRMPVILTRDAAARWLDPATPVPQLTALLRPAPDDLLDVTRVGPRVNNARIDDPDCIEPEPAARAGLFE